MFIQRIPSYRFLAWLYSNYLHVRKCSPMYTSIAYHTNNTWNVVYNIYHNKSEVVINNTSKALILNNVATNYVHLTYNYILLIQHTSDQSENNIINAIERYNGKENDVKEQQNSMVKYVTASNMMLLTVYNSKTYSENVLKNDCFIKFASRIVSNVHFYQIKNVDNIVSDIKHIRQSRNVKLLFVVFYKMPFIPSLSLIDITECGEFICLSNICIPDAIICNMYVDPPSNSQSTISYKSSTISTSDMIICAPCSNQIWQQIGKDLKDMIDDNIIGFLDIHLFALVLRSQYTFKPYLLIKSTIIDDFATFNIVSKDKFDEYEEYGCDMEPIPYSLTEINVVGKYWISSLVKQINTTLEFDNNGNRMTNQLLLTIIDYV